MERYNEKRTIELEIQDNSKSLKTQYREAVQELQKLSQTYGETYEQAANAARKAAELKDQIEDEKFKETASALDLDFLKFDDFKIFAYSLSFFSVL